MASENSDSVISKDEVVWDCEMKGFFDGDISVISIVPEVCPREVVICSFSKDKVAMSVIDRVGTSVLVRCVEN